MSTNTDDSAMLPPISVFRVYVYRTKKTCCYWIAMGIITMGSRCPRCTVHYLLWGQVEWQWMFISLIYVFTCPLFKLIYTQFDYIPRSYIHE
jgi:hypothetical protein